MANEFVTEEMKKQINDSYMRYYKLRINRGLSDKEVSEMVGVSYNAIVNWAKGRYIPATKVLYKIALFFDTQPSYIATGEYLNPNGTVVSV